MHVHQHIQTVFNSFFTTDHLQHTLKQFFQSQMLLESDFITTVVSMLCTQAVNAMFTDQGFVPFQDHPLLILSYSNMTAVQLQTIQSLMETMHENNVEYKVSPMMGGGSCILIMHKTKLCADPADVLTAFYMILHQMPQYSKNSAQIFNLFVQRILCNINLPRIHVQKSQQRITSLCLSKKTEVAHPA